MSDAGSSSVGTIVWRDLTVPDAHAIRDFYQAVVGWRPDPVAMDGYDDYNMIAAGTGEVMTGICHARGPNADVPAQWLLYVAVEDLEASAEACVRMGGTIEVAPRPLSDGRFCVIRDPAGAVLALYEQT